MVRLPGRVSGVLLVFSVLGVATTARLAVRAAATPPQEVLREE